MIKTEFILQPNRRANIANDKTDDLYLISKNQNWSGKKDISYNYHS